MLRLFIVFTVFLFSSFSFSQGKEMEFYETGKRIYELTQEENFEEAKSQALDFYTQYPDSARAFGLYLYSFIGYFHELEEKESVEDEETVVAEFMTLVDTIDEKFPGVYFLEEMVSQFLNEMYEIEILIPRLERLIKNYGDPIYYTLLIDVYNEDDEPEKADSVLLLVKERSKSEEGFKRIMVDHYIFKNQLDSAKVLADEIMLSIHADAYDFYNSARLNYLMKNKFQACEELRTAKRKGYSGKTQSWELRLNCFNEDRSNPVAIEFDKKHRDKGEILDGPAIISRAKWTPPFEKKFNYSTTEGDELKLVSTRYYSNRGEKGFIYFGNNSSFHDMKLRMLTIYLPEPWPDRKGDTLYSKDRSNILPVEFEKNHPIYIEKRQDEYQEITYIGNEIVRLKSGEEVHCEKMRVAFLVDGFLKEVDYYWFAPQRGWIASEAMDGTRIEILK